MTPRDRRLGILAGLLAAALLTATCSPVRQAGADRTVRGVAIASWQQPAELPQRLQRLVSEGLTTQEVLGKCLWESDWEELHRALRTQDLDAVDYRIMCTAARCEDPDATARTLAGNDREAAVEALRRSGAPYHRVLDTLRLLVSEIGLDVREALSLAMAPSPVGLGRDPDELAEALESPWPFNTLPEAPGPADPELVKGRVEMHDGLPVITTWGSPLERGYAQGVLLARPLASAWKSAFTHFLGRDRERVHRSVDLVFDFPEWALNELKGIYLGMRAVLGEEGLAEYGNPTLHDLKALNCVADLNMMGCSSISVWGRLVGGAEGILTGRNLDYSTLEALTAVHAVSVVHPGGGRKPFVSVGWMGLIGCYSAMNADGVCLFMHDSGTPPGVYPVDSIPRSIALREALETCDPADPVGSIHASLAEQFTASGNNIHLSWPGGAACVEWNGDEQTDAGATLRMPGDAEDGPDWLVVTNHYVRRHRSRPLVRGRDGSSGRRYDLLYDEVRGAEPGSITAADMLGWLRAVSRRGTLHSVIAHPAQRTLTAHFRRPGTDEGAPYQAGRAFDVQALLARDKFSPAGPRAPGYAVRGPRAPRRSPSTR